MVDDLIVYLKTTDTCQLNCDHCFTNGSSGQKGFFDPKQTIDFLHRLKKFRPDVRTGNISFHGGEPMLCPPELMFEVWNGAKSLWPTIWWSMQTNLTYKLTPEKVDVLNTICQKNWGTSFDYNIRWSNSKQKELWADNVKNLTQDGHQINVIVSLSNNLIQEKEPIEIINEIAALGVKTINFERITPNGNALIDNGAKLIPTNQDLDHWLLKMWDQSVEHKTYKYIKNLFFDSILSSLAYQTFSGCRCRQCEQKVFTINANGSIGGCPNTAGESPFGHITDDIMTLMNSEGRICNIQKEAIRAPQCASCEVYDICNGDCHQLPWEGSVCAAPKSLMQNLYKEQNHTLYKEFLQDFMGQE